MDAVLRSRPLDDDSSSSTSDKESSLSSSSLSTDAASVVLLGVAQDGGVPQAACGCPRCMAVHQGTSPELYPVSLGITDEEGGFHLVEASRTISKQLWTWSRACNNKELPVVQSVTLTHMHLGHMDGLGQFGKEVMDRNGVRLFTSTAVLQELEKRQTNLSPFAPHPAPTSDDDTQLITLGKGVSMELHRVPHRDLEGIGDTHAVVVRGRKKSLLFLPDHDSWKETLGLHKVDSIRDWLVKKLKVDIALLDGTFWSLDEICGQRQVHNKRDFETIPHPPISQTIQMLGRRNEHDPEINFIHFNHTNPAIDNADIQKQIKELGWGIGRQGQKWEIG